MIVKHAGTDATYVSHREGMTIGKSTDLRNSRIFKPVHPPGTIEENLPASCYVGPVDPSTLSELPAEVIEDEKRVQEARARMPPLRNILNLGEFESVCQEILSKTAWAYYS